MIRVAIVDDHDLVRAGVRAILEQDPLFQVVGETGDGQDAIRLITALRPDVVLERLEAAGQCRLRQPDRVGRTGKAAVTIEREDVS